MSFNIENYNVEYKQQILDVWEKSVLETHHFLNKKDFIEIKEFLYNFDFEILDVYCLIENEIVIGFLALQNKKIEMLFLDPKFIGKGLGKKMLDFAVLTLHANKVDVNEQNNHAKEFYEKFGFKIYERTEKDDLGKDYPILKMKL
ncbi:GNAT family N-acetyltransferase [Chishuiella sp.]|uniref:GNAT family N-acetyltransferase n=1 Tax=Chishuiella sp. TaxID=1969467 RepID=UPI0028AFC601|nr:GNAT family N-acetyltransferase [Chishuiella sp.]